LLPSIWLLAGALDVRKSLFDVLDSWREEADGEDQGTGSLLIGLLT